MGLEAWTFATGSSSFKLPTLVFEVSLPALLLNCRTFAGRSCLLRDPFVRRVRAFVVPALSKPWNNQLRVKVLEAAFSGGGLVTSLPLFEARKTACRPNGIREVVAIVLEVVAN